MTPGRECSDVRNDTQPAPAWANLEVPPNTKPTLLQSAPSGRIVVLNGFPGMGKFTILKMARQLLLVDTTCLLDNHLLIDPVEAVIPGRSDEHHELRRLVRTPIFQKLRQRAQEGCVILMTACLAEGNDRDAAFLQEHLNMVRGTNVPIFWVNAHCDQVVLEERIKSPERYQGTKTKLTDVCVLRDLVRDHSLITPRWSGDGPMTLIVETLDVSGSVGTSVSRLMDVIGLPGEIRTR